MQKQKKKDKLEKFLLENSFLIHNSSIYGGLANIYDYGVYGTLIKNKIKKLWKYFFINVFNEKIHLIDTAIFLKNNVWDTSQHTTTFNDELIDCLDCKKRFNIEKWIDNKKTCLYCNSKNLSNIKKFNLMFKVNYNITNKQQKYIYLRPETAQGIFINFNNIVRQTNSKLPFGIAQIGKSFRNEITTKNLIFKTKEFEQMEIEWFYNANEYNASKKWMNFWKKNCLFFLTNILKLDSNKIKILDVNKNELAHYANKVLDFEYEFSFGYSEIMGLADRGNFDLGSHSKNSNEKLTFFDGKEHILPNVIEPSFGVDRLFLSLIENHLKKQENKYILKLPFLFAPYNISVLPIVKNCSKEAKKIFNLLKYDFDCIYDESKSIGKRYLKYDSIGVTYCVTIDSKNIKNGCVTVRFLNTKEQKVIELKSLKNFFFEQKNKSIDEIKNWFKNI